MDQMASYGFCGVPSNAALGLETLAGVCREHRTVRVRARNRSISFRANPTDCQRSAPAGVRLGTNHLLQIRSLA